MNRKIGFIGLGYAGFPMAHVFSQQYAIVGFDHASTRIAELNAGKDHTCSVSADDIQAMLQRGTILTDDPAQLRQCNFYIITVPTPVDDNHRPDFACLASASRTVGSVLKKGDIVVYESTVYPGATEEICVPILEETSGLKFNDDFAVGYSPERINPGDDAHTAATIVKVVSASTPEALDIVRETYESVVGKGNTHPVSSIKVAEACKVLENTQRDVNIALMNEAATVFQAMGINTNEVVDAMNTKWNALGFRPGLVGGHCISVDPYYLIDKAAALGISTPLMEDARRINNSMSEFIARSTVDHIARRNSNTGNSARVLILGITYKENMPDIRNTKVKDIYDHLVSENLDVAVLDPVADPQLVKNTYDINIITTPTTIENDKFDAILHCVAHNQFQHFNYHHHLTDKGFVYDIKGNISAQYQQQIINI